jgi:chorismate synthase
MNSFGTAFKVSIFGESHGASVGIVVDGVPAGIPLTLADFEADSARRKSGAKGTTPRAETDQPSIMSGVFNDHTTGAPIMILFDNTNTRSRDYSFLKDTPRPGHADFVASKKFNGFEDYRGGGHFSGRITLGIVAAGVIAKKIIGPITVEAKLIEAGGMANIDKAVEMAIAREDSIGGVVECDVVNMPIGMGEPYFGSLDAMIAHMMFSIPAIKGIEFGTGFAAAKMNGSEHNDCFIDASGKTATNNAGGINGGISNGNDLKFKVAVKPTSSIHHKQHTYNFTTNQMVDLNVEGRHDTCIALRIPVVVENATAIVLADMLMQMKRG